MTNNGTTEQRMQHYSETFDFYMDATENPDFKPANDTLGQYIKSVVADNLQLNSHDPLWTELLKEDLMRFLKVLLSLYEPVREEHSRQSQMINKFVKAGINGKQQMWNEVSQTVKYFYSPHEVNLEGYIHQMQQMNDEGKSTVLSALAKDWKKANDERLEHMEKEILEKHRINWERSVRNRSSEDYERARKTDDIFYKYPALTEIIRIIGREKPENKDVLDDILLKYKPQFISNHANFEEIEEISMGKELNHLIPPEISLLADNATEPVFFHKYASGRLQVFSNRPKISAQEKITQRICNKPRLQMGPIIVAVDTSASMRGKPEQIANSLLIQLVRMARKQKRKCLLITFSVRAKTIDLAHPANWYQLKDFLNHGYSGGTDGEEMFRFALEALETENYSLADVLVISDFEFPSPVKKTLDKVYRERSKGVCFYGLQIGTSPHEYNDILDRIWQI